MKKHNGANKVKVDWRKTRVGSFIHNRLVKRGLSLALSTAMLISTISAFSFSDFFEVAFGIGGTIPVQAADKYDIEDYISNKTIIIDGQSYPLYTLEDTDSLIRYSHVYYEYTGHENDVLFINYGSGSVTGELTGFESIGKEGSVFNGMIIFGQTTAAVFNLNCPLFGEVNDSVKIVEGSTEAGSQDNEYTLVVSNSVKPVTISRTNYSETPEPLFANTVVDDGTAAAADWDVTAAIYTEVETDYYWPFSGYIGTISDGADVTLKATNNVVSGGTAADIHRASGDIGLLCCTMGTSSRLNASYSGSVTSFDISTSSGNAGGFVGTMGSGSTLELSLSSNPQSSGDEITTGSGYAGALVGSNDGGSVSVTMIDPSTGDGTGDPYPISQQISGTSGVGAVFGFFRPRFVDNGFEFDINDFDIDEDETVLNSSGSVGGLFGVLNNASGNGTADTITITTNGSLDTVVVNNAGTTVTNYGGLVGLYEASETADRLEITGINTTVNNNIAASYYGGAIGCVGGTSYVSFDDYKLNSASGDKSTMFGGLIGKVNNGYISVGDVTIGDTAIADFNGGGLIGHLDRGVLGLIGDIDVSNATPVSAADNGLLVGKRGNAFIFADGWTYSYPSAERDNIGSWGDVLIIDGTKLTRDQSGSSNVFTESASHVITVDSFSADSIANVADYVKASICFQIDLANNSFVSGSQLSSDSNLTFTGDIDLSGTGARGITRDNGDKITYSGTVDGGAHSVVLDIKNVGTGKPVYRHQYNGLFGVVKNATVEDLYIGGTINIKSMGALYAGALAGYSDGTLTVSGCKTLSGLSVTASNSGGSYVAGRFVGSSGAVDNKFSGMGTLSVSSCEFDGTIQGSGSQTVGGVFGRLSVGSGTADWSFDGVTLKGSVIGNSTVAGLVATTNSDGKATIKIGTDSAVTATGSFVVEGSGNEYMGGLLGFHWPKTNVIIDDFEVSGNPTVKQTGSGGTAGLVYRATGKWEVNKLHLGSSDNNGADAIKMLTGNANSVGMIVNKGKDGEDGIYLILPSGYDYKLALAEGSTFKANAVFDEICAYSADSSANIMNNGQGIISVSTSGLKMEASAEDSLSYKNQTAQGAAANPNTRYYYNLDTDTYPEGGSSDSASVKLMSWGVRQYAAKNLKKYFADPFGNTIPSGIYNLKGYSWYPVSIGSSMTVNGTFTFYNQEFTSCENMKSTANKWVPDDSTHNQHFMMQNGLFYNVTNDLNIGDVVLRGTIGAVDTSGTGALIYGKVTGKSSASEDISVIDSSSGSVSLAGIKVWNYQTVSPDYAPLLINKTGSFVTLDISNVHTDTGYAADEKAGTSLIGRAGDSATDTFVTAIFSNIKLDSRTASGSPDLSGHGYNTTQSIFSRATLLERLVGDSGTYLYSFEDDWGSGDHNVTYGLEVGYGFDATTSQYPGQEQHYFRATVDDPKYPTQYSSSPSAGGSPSDAFSGFLPYVKTVSSAAEITAGTGTYYQLKVNHQPLEQMDGCGTYDDPYIIRTSSDLVKVSKWISGNFEGATIDANFGGTWCGGNHKTYTVSGGGFASTDGTTTKSSDEMRRYLCEAYYKIIPSGSNIELADDSGFIGLGQKEDGFRFRGVIVGGVDNLSIVNKTAYPLINYSDGSVVKDINITVNRSNILLDSATETADYISSGSKFAYGAVISAVAGGDNIIDNVQVNFGTSRVEVQGKKAQFEAVGGYVGVVVNGGVIFKNMPNNITGIGDSNVYVNPTNGTIQAPTSKRTNMVSDDNLAWLYVNPIVGRVINGFAVNETDGYHPRNEDCELDNGTKHYSITDIKRPTSNDDKLSVTSGMAVTVPDSQSFFIMSIIVNSGMGGLKEYNKTANVVSLGYYNGSKYLTSRRAEYTNVGRAASSSDADYLLSTKDTYLFSTNDNVINNVPYIVYYYTQPVTNYYYAKQIGNSAISSTITLTASSYDLPDGFQGIGSKYNTGAVMNITNFNGNGAAINLNMNYNYYFTYKNATSVDTFDNTYQHIDLVGLGLFNSQGGKTNGTSSRYYNFILSGKVHAECIDNKFTNGKTHIPYTATSIKSGNDAYTGGSSIDINKMINVGALIGTSNNEQYIDSVSLRDIDVKGIKCTGGLIGLIPGSKTTIKNTESAASYGIKVHGAGNTGGMVGRSQNGVITIDNNNARYSIEEVVCDCEGRVGGYDYNYGVGGFIGNCRGSGNSIIEIKNVIVGEEDQDALTNVLAENAEINAGGMIGIVNKAYLNLSNCKIYNQNVESQYTSAGLVGYFASSTANSTISNVKIYCRDDLDGMISSLNNYSGGFLGAGKRDVYPIIISDSDITGYTISGKENAGGIIGQWGHFANEGQAGNVPNRYVTVKNISVSNCAIYADENTGCVGGVLGRLNQPTNTNLSYADTNSRRMFGYNIRVYNVDLHGKYCGSLCGFADTTYNYIKIAGFSRYDDRQNSSMIDAVVGNDTYGNGGYVVFADYAGSSLGTAGTDYSTLFSPIHNSGNVTLTYVDDNGDKVNFPFVTSTKPTVIGNTCSVKASGSNKFTALSGPGYITSDGVSRVAITSILDDMNSSSTGYYALAKNNIQTAPGYITDFDSAYATINSHISTYQDEMGTKAVTGINFPLLVVDDAKPVNTTALVNNYIRFLTNTDFDYNNKNDAICTVKISKCTFDGTTLKIDDNSACLEQDPMYFRMYADDTDTAAESSQFTLIDVQFKDPSDTSKIAYHLYIPVYVRKLLQYDFNIRLESGSTYLPADSLSQNTMLENLGTPVTAEFEYVYSRTNDEWQKAIEAGDSLLTNYDKKLLFTNSSLSNQNVLAGFESGNAWYDCHTKMVLVDSQRSGKAYYLDSLYSDAFSVDTMPNQWLDLTKFRDSDRTAFEAAYFNDMMTVTAERSSSGTFVCVDDFGGTATVKDNSGLTYNGKMFRLKTDSDTITNANTQLYTITVSNATSISEHYYLTIFTEADYEQTLPVYHYIISAPDTFGSFPYPSRRLVSDKDAGHLIMGDIYTNSITITPATEETDLYNAVHSSGDGDYVIQATLSSTVGIKPNAKPIVGDYLAQTNSIEIYQSFLATLNMKNGQNSDRGIKALKSASVANYKVNGRVAANQDLPYANANFIEFSNNENLKTQLAYGNVTITADITLTFDDEDLVGNEDNGQPAQFYPGPVNDVGTTLIASSNIASNKDMTAYSKVRKEAEDTNHLYYYNSTESVGFLYSAYPDPDFGQFGQLGINANELDENPSPLKTLGVYDISRFQSSASNARYLQIEIEMLTIDDDYNMNNKLNVGDYITDLEFITESTATSVDTSNAKKWVYVYPVSAFNLESQTYQIPIDYAVFTGETDEFENAGRKYSNYEVLITVSMLDENQDYLANSSATDYIKYTNARIFVGRVDPNKTGSGNQGNGG